MLTKYGELKFYPTTQVVKGYITPEEYIDSLVLSIAGDMLSRRFDPKNADIIFKLVMDKLKEKGWY